MDTQHRYGPPGILLMAGPAIRPATTLEHASIYDVLPTILYLLDLPLPDDGHGSLLTAAIRPEALAERVVRHVPTYCGTVTGPRPDIARSEAMDAEQVRKLKALGYL